MDQWDTFSAPSRLEQPRSRDEVHNERHVVLDLSSRGCCCAIGTGNIDLVQGLGEMLSARFGWRSFSSVATAPFCPLGTKFSQLKESPELLNDRFTFLHSKAFDDKSSGLFTISANRLVAECCDPVALQELVLGDEATTAAAAAAAPLIYVSSWLMLFPVVPEFAERTMFSRACVEFMSTRGEKRGKLTGAAPGTPLGLKELKLKLGNSEV